MNNLPKITLLRGVPSQDMASTWGAAPPELPSTWGAAPPEAGQDTASTWDASGATDVFKKIDASAFQSAAVDCRKRPASEGGAALPAAFKRRPQAGGDASSPAMPAAFRRAGSQRESQWAGGETSWASSMNSPQQGGQAQNAMQGCGGGGGGGMGADAMNPMMAMMSMMQQGGGQNMMQQGGGQNAMQGGGMEAMNPMMRMMMMMQQGSAGMGMGMGMGMGGGGAGMDMEAMMQQAKQQAKQEAQQAQMMAMMQQAGGMEGMNPMMRMMMMQQQMAGAMAGQQPQMSGAGGEGAGMMQGIPAPENGSPAMDMSSWASIPDPAAEESEQAKAVREAVEATQQAQYMQQVQFLQQVSAHEAGKMKEVNAHAQQNTGLFQDSQSRFTDEYRAFKLCRFFGKGECMQGRRCVYAHCFEELHPASPDMPIEEEKAEPSFALSAANAPSKKEQDNAPNMRLSKKRELCRKFMDTGNCSRGDVCPNAHGEKEIGKLAFVLYDKVKLKICMAWEKGKCSYGDKCFHAHGDNEIGMKRREFFDGPPIKRRADGQSLEDWRGEILRFPHLPSFPL